MEGCCLDRFINTVNVSSFYDNGGGYVHQSNDTVQDFHLHLSDSKSQNAATTTAHLYTLLAKLFEKKIEMMRDGIIWDQTDVCLKNYRCYIAYYMMSFYQNHIKLSLIDLLIHQVIEKI